jgi:hypothetical protein
MGIRDLLQSPPTTPAPRLTSGEVEDLLDHLFAPPSVDPGQVPMHASGRLESGELRLALAILEDALRCALRHHDSHIAEQRTAAREAMEWIRSDDDSPPFTFVRLCQLFDLDPDWVRDSVRPADPRVRATARDRRPAARCR